MRMIRSVVSTSSSRMNPTIRHVKPLNEPFSTWDVIRLGLSVGWLGLLGWAWIGHEQMGRPFKR